MPDQTPEVSPAPPSTDTTPSVRPASSVSYAHIAVCWFLVGVVGTLWYDHRNNPAPDPKPVAPTLESIQVVPASATGLGTGSTQQFAAAGRYSDGTTKPIAADWSSVFPAVATVDKDGLARGIANGNTMIVAESGTMRAGALLTVGQAPDPTPDPPSPTPDPQPPMPPWIPPGPKPDPPTPTPMTWRWKALDWAPGWEGLGTDVDGSFAVKDWRRVK